MSKIKYTTKPGEYALEYIADHGTLRINIDKTAPEYLPWCVFITEHNGPNHVEATESRTVLHNYAQTLTRAKELAQDYVDTHPQGQSAEDRYRDRLPDMPDLDLLADLASATRQNKYGSHGDQIAMLEAEILRRMQN